MEPSEKTKTPITLSTIFFRGMSGFGAGVTGTVVLGIIMFLTWGMVGNTLSPQDLSGLESTTDQYGFEKNDVETAHPLFLSIVLMAVFLATLVSNLTFSFIFSAIEEKYATRSTALTQVFMGNMILLLLVLPLYLVLNIKYSVTGVASAAVIHITLSSILTIMIMEILNTQRHVLVGVYGMILGLIIFFWAAALFFSGGLVIALLVLPLLFAAVGIGSGIVEMFYNWIAEVYGIDFLNSEKRYGSDYADPNELGDPGDDYDDANL